MHRIVNLQDYRKEKENNIQEVKRIVNNFPFTNSELEKECNYYLEKYLNKIK